MRRHWMSFLMSLFASLGVSVVWSCAASALDAATEATPLVRNLRQCVRAHAAEAVASGVRTEEDGDFFRRRCLADPIDLFAGRVSEPSRDIAPVALAPGVLRAVIREEWAAYQADRMPRAPE